MKRLINVFKFASVVMSLTVTAAYGLTFDLSDMKNDVVGNVYSVRALPGDNFDTLARRYDVGYFELEQANPNVNPTAVAPNEKIVVPAQFIIPKPHKGIFLNVAEMRLYYFPTGKNEVLTFPVGIGEQGHNTPTGNYYILTKDPFPTWRAPDSVRAKYMKRGIVIPPTVPPGIANPLGNYAMRLNTWSTLIHGTNEPESVGKRSSAGCVHLYPEDIIHLFRQVELKTPVRIIDSIYKVGWSNKKLYLEVEQPLTEDKQKSESDLSPMLKAVKEAANTNKHLKIDWAMAKLEAKRRSGIPVVIGTMG